MSAFLDQLAADMDVFFNPEEFGCQIVHVSATTGARKPTRANRGEERQTDGEWGGGRSIAITFVLIKADVPSPTPHDLIEEDDHEWQIQGIVGGDETTWTVQAVRDLRPKR